MRYLKLFENFTPSELEEDLKWIMVNFLDDKYRFQLKQNVHDKLFIYTLTGYDVSRLDVLKNLLEDLYENLEFYIKDLEIGIGFSEYINLYKNIKEYNIENWKINDDLTIDVDGIVYLEEKKLTKLPLKFNKVSGHFYCSVNNLTSLEGSPKYVGGSFECIRNVLTSLKDCPKSVGLDFLCSFNGLTSLEGAPKEVGNDFYCRYNQLTSLECAPKSVGGDFKCDNNQLTTLEGLPEKIGGKIYCDSGLIHLIPKNYKWGWNT